jgi:hypothetical protein
MESRSRQVQDMEGASSSSDSVQGPRPSDKHLGRHLDGNYLNNSPKNLRWGTYKDNAQDSIKHGTFYFSEQGGKNGNAKLTDKKATKIWKAISEGVPVRTLASRYDVGVSTIENIKYGRNWNHITGLPISRKPARFNRDNVNGVYRT